MSDNVIRLVPANPTFKPSESAARNAEEYAHTIAPDAEEIQFRYFTSVQFVDAGQNWSGVACPYCRAEIDEWWPDAVSRAYESNFRNLRIDTPCCGKTTSLNDLNYGWIVAFGSCALEIRNPEVSNLDPDQMEKLCEILGCDVTQVVAHN